MTETTVQDPAAARREAELAALEAAIVAAATAALAARLARTTRLLTGGFRWAVADPARWLTIRRQAARELRAVRPGVGAAVTRMLPRAAQLGARHAGATLPAGHAVVPDLTREALDRVDRDLRARLDRAARTVLDGSLDTPARLDDAVGRVDAVTTEAQAVAGDAVARTAAEGTLAVADDQGLGLVVVTERDACLSCRSMAGARRGTDGLFRPVRVFAARIIPWLPGGVRSVPFHRACRCGLQVETEGLVDGLRREAERSVARGESLYDSLPARLRAVDRLLASSSSRLPKTVRARAASDRARGRFPARDRAGANRPATRAETTRTG